jgi:hypothetical protein
MQARPAEAECGGWTSSSAACFGMGDEELAAAAAPAGMDDAGRAYDPEALPATVRRCGRIEIIEGFLLFGRAEFAWAR